MAQEGGLTGALRRGAGAYWDLVPVGMRDLDGEFRSCASCVFACGLRRFWFRGTSGQGFASAAADTHIASHSDLTGHDVGLGRVVCAVQAEWGFCDVECRVE